jgi:halocyanin-like protein
MASAGCLSTTGSGDVTEEDSQIVTRTNETSRHLTATTTRTPTAADTPTTAEPTSAEPTDSPSTPEYIPLDEWVANSSNFDGIVDRTDHSEVTVLVGAEGNGGSFAFEPPALLLRSNTTVIWVWTSKSGAHNVDFRTLEVDSGDPTDAAGATFEHEFERPGTHLYACDAHRPLGMKGGFEVIE